MPDYQILSAACRYALFPLTLFLSVLYIPAAAGSFNADENAWQPDRLQWPLVDPSPPAQITFPEETPCFPISQVRLAGNVAPQWLPLQRIADRALGQCLGAKGVELLTGTLQNYLIDHGYFTSRVLDSSQDLKNGRLTLIVLPATDHNMILNESHYLLYFNRTT